MSKQKTEAMGSLVVKIAELVQEQAMKEAIALKN